MMSKNRPEELRNAPKEGSPSHIFIAVADMPISLCQNCVKPYLFYLLGLAFERLQMPQVIVSKRKAS